MKATHQSEDASVVIEIPPEEIARYERQPRRFFSSFDGDEGDEEIIKSLARSIRRNGQLHPVDVRICNNGTPYELIDGERRWRAISMLNAWLKKEGKDPLPVRALIKNVSDEEQFECSIASNAGRQNFLPIEEIWIIQRLLFNHKKDPRDIAAIFSRSLQWAQKRCKIARLPANIIEKMHPRHGKESLSISAALALANSESSDLEFAAEEIAGMPAKHATLHLRVHHSRAESEPVRRGRKRKTLGEDFETFLNKTIARGSQWKRMPPDAFLELFRDWDPRHIRDLMRSANECSLILRDLHQRLQDIG